MKFKPPFLAVQATVNQDSGHRKCTRRLLSPAPSDKRDLNFPARGPERPREATRSLRPRAVGGREGAVEAEIREGAREAQHPGDELQERPARGGEAEAEEEFWGRHAEKDEIDRNEGCRRRRGRRGRGVRGQQQQ